MKNPISTPRPKVGGVRPQTAVSAFIGCNASCKGCKTAFCGIVEGFGVAGWTPLANSSDFPGAAFIGLSNEITAPAGDGWARILYGEWPHAEGLQRFGKAEADEMVGYFRNTWNTLKRALTGLPIFKGHPDLADVLRRQRTALANDAAGQAARRMIDQRIADLERQYPDKREYGAIADMEARDDGLYLKPILTPAGAALVNEGKKFFSPHWLAKTLGVEAGRTVYAPALFMSIGLTDRPNIAGTSLVNSVPPGAGNQKSNQESTMPKWLLDLLGLANEATEDQVKSKVTSLLARPEPTALANEQTARTTAEAQLAEIKPKLTAAETALANEKTAHAATVKARNEALVGSAIREGKILEAAKPVWLGRLERDFATESVALANEAGALKTTAKTAGLGERKVPNAARDQFIALVNEALPAHGNNWDKSWHAVKATAKGKALFEQIDTVDAK